MNEELQFKYLDISCVTLMPDIEQNRIEKKEKQIKFQQNTFSSFNNNDCQKSRKPINVLNRVQPSLTWSYTRV